MQFGSSNQQQGISIPNNNMNSNEFHHQQNKPTQYNSYQYLGRQIESKVAAGKISIQGGDNNIKAAACFIVTCTLIALTIAAFRQNSTSIDHSKNVENLQAQFQEMKKEMMNDSNQISFLTNQIQQLKSELTQKFNDIRSKDERDSTQIQSLTLINATTNSRLESFERGIYEIKEQSKAHSQTPIDQIISIGQIKNSIETIHNGQLEAVSLQSKINEQIQKDISVISDKIKAERVSINDLIVNVALVQKDIEEVKKDIEDIKKESEEVASLSKIVSVIQADSSWLKQEVNLFSPKIEEIKTNLNNITLQLSRQQNLVYYSPNNTSTPINIESEISLIKQSITNIQSSINTGGIVNSIQIYGPFVSNTQIQDLNLQDKYFQFFQTTQICQVKTKGRSIITLIATGLGICGSCHGQATFFKNREQFLPSSGDDNNLSGAQFIYVGWMPINLTQEFIVEEGTYEFVLGFNLANGGRYTIRLQNLSFVVKVMQYS